MGSLAGPIKGSPYCRNFFTSKNKPCHSNFDAFPWTGNFESYTSPPSEFRIGANNSVFLGVLGRFNYGMYNLRKIPICTG